MPLPHVHTYVIDRRARRGIDHRWFNKIFHVWVRRTPDTPDTALMHDAMAEAHVQVIAGLPRRQDLLTAALSVGGIGSETPLDAHLVIGGTGFYFGGRFGSWSNRLAQRLTHPAGEMHQYSGRQFRLAIHGGSAYWSVWTHPSEWHSGEFPKWRESFVSLHPLDYIHGGPLRYAYDTVAETWAELQLHDGTYPVHLKLQTVTRARPRGPKREMPLNVDWDAPHGIPTHFDHSGGWKGDRTYGSGFTVDERNAWAREALDRLRAWVYDQRARTGFITADPIEEHA